MEAAELKRLLTKARKDNRGSYPVKLREAVVAYAARRRAQKGSGD
jgi:hypothetical protein